MKGPLGIVAAGTTFAGTVIVAIVLGIWLGGRQHQEYVLIATLAGIVVGAYAAYRLIAAALTP
jgi:hypothetical protein